MAIQWP